MGVRKNAKFLSFTERENLIQAFVMIKADIVNPGALPADQYSRWDEHVAIHRMIQSVNTPDGFVVNFGHGGLGAYGFLSWHGYFLYRLELQLQSYVPGVMLPYWDWTDPSPALLLADYMGPDGDPLSGDQVRQGYFAAEAPGTGVINLTPAPAWWPPALTGWHLHSAFGPSWEGPLRRNINAAAALPAAASLRSALDKVDYSSFQNALESGAGVVPVHGLHNSLHTWWGGGSVSHMSSVVVSPFDPMFYLHHCNADRLWAMWQMDGHADEYPLAGGDPHHHRTDPMYPWVGGAAGYSSNNSFGPIVMPDFSALGEITPEDVLDHRALGYSYDTQAIIGLALDRTGSMTGLTPDPMLGAPDVTKWEAAKRGVSAFLLDCEAAYAAAETYLVAGVKTFRRLAVNDFAAVFAGDPYGLVKVGGGYPSATFDAAVGPLTPGGSTPLVDALVDAHATLVAPPFSNLPADERRYLAILTDGIGTSGLLLTDVADGSLTNTAVFAMGFGTGADVDYPTIEALTDKGVTLASEQVFHGENAGVIDKFYSQALAAAIGFTPVMDPVLELFAGEHAHMEFTATSAEDSFFVTAQGMDFSDDWSYQLIGPDGHVVYADGSLLRHGHGHGAAHAERHPQATARRGHGRLSLFLQRDSADDSAWIGTWALLVSWRAKTDDAMVVLDPGELIFPVAAGPIRGPRYSRLLTKVESRKSARAIAAEPRHRLDIRPTSTNRDDSPACSVVINLYARTRLNLRLTPHRKEAFVGGHLAVDIATDIQRGAVSRLGGFSRLVAPARDLAALVRNEVKNAIPNSARLDKADPPGFDAARILARLEAENSRLAETRDEELRVISHHDEPPHVHVDEPKVAAPHHISVWIEGIYHPDHAAKTGHDGRGGKADHGKGERFIRLLSASVAVGPKPPETKREPKKDKLPAAKKQKKRKPKK